jgi:hypothetical protein
MMQVIYENGPIKALFTVYKDFINYLSGVYQYVTDSSLGRHDIRIIG